MKITSATELKQAIKQNGGKITVVLVDVGNIFEDTYCENGMVFDVTYEIYFDLTGIILVPEDQMLEVTQFPLSMDSVYTVCPYCIAFWYKHRYDENRTGCEECPLYKAGNGCNNIVSSYNKAARILSNRGMSMLEGHEKVDELKALIEQYNKELPTLNISAA